MSLSRAATWVSGRAGGISRPVNTSYLPRKDTVRLFQGLTAARTFTAFPPRAGACLLIPCTTGGDPQSYISDTVSARDHIPEPLCKVTCVGSRLSLHAARNEMMTPPVRDCRRARRAGCRHICLRNALD